MQIDLKLFQSSQRDAEMHQEIHKLTRRLLQEIKSSCCEEGSSLHSLIHQFLEDLLCTRDQSTKLLLQNRIKNDFNLGNEEKPFQKHNGQPCSNFYQQQWKNNQKSAVLVELEKILSMMIECQRKSSNQFQHSNLLLELEKEIDCFCNKCLIARAAKSDKQLFRPDYLKGEPTAFSLKEIQQCFASSGRVKRRQQNNKIELILDLIRSERKQLLKAKQLKKERNGHILSLYGDLLGLDKEKYMDDCLVDEVEKKKQKLYQQLFKKNLFNSREISRFNRRVFLKKNQNKIMKRSSFQSSLKLDEQSRPIISKVKLSQHKVVSITTPQTSRLMSRALKISRKDSILEQIPKIRQNIQKYSLIKTKVDKSLQNVQLREEKRSSILKNIVFDAGDLFFVDKRSLIRARVEKPYFSRFDRMMKSSRDMVKMGGVRRSLDQQIRAPANA